ncbi:DUF1826 domain-containing protein [Acetobacter cerevisiae]|uniref:DUF1826 domain-containing protein n=1 Tax=Acetobacter cerevisiae TaxID=178900 RepID=A0A149V784_9PROT|nr:DUF1826 domain-containing protein [Acetobacter cerevisiae]KXV75995.1 hypothetical protein AD954_13590 [Acetobacter cerevisiae]
MTAPFTTPAVTEKRLMPFPDESAIMSRDPHQRRTATLFVESWPAPAPDSPEMPPLAYPAPHVIACSNASVLLDLHRGDIDMVVWGRVVPDVWHKALAEAPSSQTVFDMSGTPDELADALASRAVIKAFPPLVLSDVAELSSLFSAVTQDCPQRLRLTTESLDDTGFEAVPGALRLVCCYGSASAEWCSYPDPNAGMTSTLDSFSVAFIKGSDGQDAGCLHRICHAGHDTTAPGIHLIIDTVRG